MAPPGRGGGGFRGGRGGGAGGRGGARGGSRGGFGGGRGGGRGGGVGGGRGRGGPRGGGRGGARGGRGGAAPKGGNKVVVERHRHEGVFISRGKQDDLVTRSYAPGIAVYGEKRIQTEETTKAEDGSSVVNKIEYRVWNPFRSKIAAGILAGVDNLYIAPGKKVLYLGAASGTSVSHVSDIVGAEGRVYAVEFSIRSGRELLQMSMKRNNINPLVFDARMPVKYRFYIDGMVDVIFCDVAQPNPAQIVYDNARVFLRKGGYVLLSIKASCVDSTRPQEEVYADVVARMRKFNFKPKEQVSLETYERGHALVVFQYNPDYAW
ncbi:hypothetical protein TD95_004128 [Thielaviopsis punctulata]|uniref:rRNA 2'-O-methyltransferase fibrillarin n=1 Tax=Thielaviopsis punctulata TaxID=72032 RepID=A0A0F4ZBG5_9PEZI|nr:hypothetical protein TD95_004128 [Thielaviopsis punctulata]